MNRNIIIILTVISILTCCSKPLEIEHPLLWGFAIEGFPVTKELLEKQKLESKISAQLILFYLQWPANPLQKVDIQPSLDAIWKNGSIPCLSWEPMFVQGDVINSIPYELLLKGEYDPYLNAMALEVKEWGKPLIIRFAHEMNLSHYHWGTTKEAFGPGSPEIYIKMFQYVVNVFRKQKVPNVLWAFCPNAESVPLEPWNQPTHYYPGDDYVDILGMDGYNWDITPKIASTKNISWTQPWRSFEQVFKPLYLELKTISQEKPILVFETATVDRAHKGKSPWVMEALKVAKKWKLWGLIWFQIKKEEDWRLNQDGNYSYVPILNGAAATSSAMISNFIETKAANALNK